MLAPLLDVLLLGKHGQGLSLDCVDKSNDELAFRIEALKHLNELLGLCFKWRDANFFIFELS